MERLISVGIFRPKYVDHLQTEVIPNIPVRRPEQNISFSLYKQGTDARTLHYFYGVLFKNSAVALWLVRSTSERAVRVRALAGDIVMCSWARYLTLTLGKLLGKPDKLRGSDLRWTSIPSRGSRNTSSRFML